MKKLMTMLSAVALAFGVQAAGTWHSGTDFEGLTVDADFDLTSGDGIMWKTNGAPTLKIVDTTDRVLSFDRAKQWQDESALRALHVQTTFGQPVFRTNETAVAMGQVFVDTLIKPTVCEDDPPELEPGAKIAIWFKEVRDEGDIPVATNLMITAGYIQADGTVVRTNYTCATTIDNAEAWQRFTVKSFSDITSTGESVPGFVVFRNGSAVVCGDSKGSSSAAALNNLNTQAGLYNNHHMLFPSAVRNDATISAVGFDGNGLVDDVLFTDYVEEFAAPFKTFNLAWDQYVTGFTYTVKYMGSVIKSDTLSGLAAAGSMPIEVEDSVTVEITAVSHSGSYVDGELATAGAGIKADGNVFSVDVAQVTDASTGTITSMNPAVYVTIGEGAPTPYGTLADAFAAINGATGAATMQLADDLTLVEAVTLADDANLTGVTIDFAGETITYAGNDVAITANVPLTLTNSTVAVGGISAANGTAVSASTNLTITAGEFTGTVVVGGNTAAITGGTFNNAISVTSTASGFITGGTFANQVSNALLAKGYASTPLGPTGPYVVGIATPSITYFGDYNEMTEEYEVLDLAPASYTYGDATINLPTPVKPGYVFAGWKVLENVEFVDFVYVQYETEEDLELYTSWTEDIVTYDITVTNGVNMTVAVITNGVAAGEAGVYTVVSNDSAKVIFTAAENYNIEGARAKTNEYNNISANIAVEAPVATQDSQDPIPPIPADATPAQVTAAIEDAGFADETAIKALINGDKAKYNAFKDWADTVTGGETAVVGSSYAAVSYQLSPIVEGATLFANKPTLTFTEIKPAAAGSNWDVTVELKDGVTPVQLKAAADAFASRVWKGGSLTTMTQCTGADVTAAVQEGGTKVKLTVTPPGGTSGFIKIKAE